MQRNERGRARGVHGERRTTEIEHAADRAGGHVQQTTREAVCLERRDTQVRGPFDRREQLRIGFATMQRTIGEQRSPDPGACQVMVAGLADADVDACTRPVEWTAFETRVLQRLPSEIDQQPMLGIHRPGALRRNPVMGRGEPLDVVDEGNLVGIGPMRIPRVNRVVEAPVPPPTRRYLAKL